MTDLALDLEPGRGRRVGLEDAIRRAVTTGQLAAGVALPSTRALAAELGLARATVVAAYEQLVVEGYLLARRGSGTIVADVRTPAAPPAAVERERSRWFTDLLPGEPDPSSFPRAQWLTSLRHVLASAPDDLFSYDDPRGEATLRTALAEYLSRARAVVVDPSRVVVFGGYTAALWTLADALRAMGVERVAMEDPCLPPHVRAVRSTGLAVVPVAVDADGLRAQDLDDEGAVVCTPTHQYPVGVALSPARRAALVAWARERGAWVIEDDYDGEFRFDRAPVGALQGLDPDRVVYAGTASKALAPGLGIAWLVLPPALVDAVVAAKRLRRLTVSTLEQAALADFIRTGRFDRHVRRLRGVYRMRRDEVHRVLAPHFEVVGLSAGLHLTALTEREDELVERAASHGVALFGIRNHVIAEPAMSGLVVGYGRSPAHAFPAAVQRLRELVD